MEGLTLRDMRAEDLPQVHAIEERLERSPWSMMSFSHELRSNDSILKVAEFNGQIVGYICIKILLDVAHIMKIMVIPEFRRKGVGTGLVQACVEVLIKNNVRELTLEVRESNYPAINFYKKLGFELNGRRKFYYKRPEEDALIMGMRIK